MTNNPFVWERYEDLCQKIELKQRLERLTQKKERVNK